MTDELKFPLEFNQCPVCGSTRRVIQSIVDEETEKGNMTAGNKVPLFSHAQPVFEANRQLIALSKKVPVIMAFFDVCADCGTVYAVRIDKGFGSVGMKPAPGPRGGPLPPGFGVG